MMSRLLALPKLQSQMSSDSGYEVTREGWSMSLVTSMAPLDCLLFSLHQKHARQALMS
jgi:hypothetical protein